MSALNRYRKNLRHLTAAAILLPLSSCLAPDAALHSAVKPTVPFGLRGAVYSNDIATTTMPASAKSEVPSLEPDETVATASIAAVLSKRPKFEIDMSFAPGDGADALKAALTEALDRAAPAGQSGNYKLRGIVTVENTGSGEARVTINWKVARADGVEIGAVQQLSDTWPSEIAAYWGDFARSSAKPAAEGIYALLSTEARPKGNAS
ncbi:MAG: hypothetical protein Q7T44_05800 [Parvibaculum sp.]|nr:hypothetical protein [Parvibaculum sp.]